MWQGASFDSLHALRSAGTLHVSKPTHWLESRFHFSFANHYDPERNHFGTITPGAYALVSAPLFLFIAAESKNVDRLHLVLSADQLCTIAACLNSNTFKSLQTENRVAYHYGGAVQCCPDAAFPEPAGALRVLNDDLVTARNGFGAHPHRDAEIFSYVVDGELSHRDNLGNQEALGRGSVQYLSAGTGVVHSVGRPLPVAHGSYCRVVFVDTKHEPDVRMPVCVMHGFQTTLSPMLSSLMLQHSHAGHTRTGAVQPTGHSAHVEKDWSWVQEMNDGDVTTRFLQIWLTPNKRGVKPQYGSKTFQPEDRRNR